MRPEVNLAKHLSKIFCLRLVSWEQRIISVAHLTNFSFEFFHEFFTEDASLLLLYHGAKSQK